MSKVKRVKNCLGHYGEKEDKDCKEDCNDCPEVISQTDVIFCKRKRAYPCNIFCDEVDYCKQCYWGWWFKNRDKRCLLKEEIKKYMEKNNLKWKTNQKFK